MLSSFKILNIFAKIYQGTIILVLLIPAIIRGVLAPYWISTPRIGSVDQWPLFASLAHIYPLLFAGFLLLGATQLRKTGDISRKWMSMGISIFALLFLLSVIFYQAKIYFLWQESTLGRYLMWPNSKFYDLVIGDFTLGYTYHLVSCIICWIVFGFIQKLTHSRALSTGDVLLLSLCALVLGPIGITYVILGACVISIVMYIFNFIWYKQSGFIQITIPLLIMSYIYSISEPWLR
jgi:hypothetical protein